MSQSYSAAAILSLYAELNVTYFGGILPPCDIRWSRRLTRAAGTIDVRKPEMTLSVPLLVEAYAPTSLFPPQYEVCGVHCDDGPTALREIMKHEMIHLWLFVLGRPHGHTPEFRAKARSIGQPKTRHGIALPPPKSGWIYVCPRCAMEYPRRRRMSKPAACGACCKKHAGGRFDERFKLRGRRVG